MRMHHLNTYLMPALSYYFLTMLSVPRAYFGNRETINLAYSTQPPAKPFRTVWEMDLIK